MVAQYMALPPEVNATRIEGPGEGSVLAAGTAMGALGTALAAATATVESSVSTLAAVGWQGPSGVAAAASFQPHVAWMTETATQCAMISAKHAAFGEAYRAANLAIPKIGLVTANQTEHGVLQATNFMGINTAPIATNRTTYGTYWTEAGAAMGTYQAVGAVESAPLPAAPPPPITSANGLDLAAMGLSMGVQLGAGLAQNAMTGATSGLDALTGAASSGTTAAVGPTTSALSQATGANPATGQGAAQSGGTPGTPAAKPAGADGQQLTSLLTQMPQSAAGSLQSLGSAPAQGGSQIVSGPAQAVMGPLQNLMTSGGTGLGGSGTPISGSGLNPMAGMYGPGMLGGAPGGGGDGGRLASQSAGLMRSAGVGGGGYTMPGGWRSTADSVGISAAPASGLGSGRAVAGGADLRGATGGTGYGSSSPGGMFAPPMAGGGYGRRSGGVRNSAAELSWEEDPFGAEEDTDLPMMLASPTERGI